jgi:hypothetical protein
VEITFLKQDAHGLDAGREPFVELRAPLIANLRSNPFERGEYDGVDYGRWFIGPCLRDCSCGDLHRAVGAKLQGISTKPEARQLQSQSRHGGRHQRRHRQQLITQPAQTVSWGRGEPTKWVGTIPAVHLNH